MRTLRPVLDEIQSNPDLYFQCFFEILKELPPQAYATFAGRQSVSIGISAYTRSSRAGFLAAISAAVGDLGNFVERNGNPTPSEVAQIIAFGKVQLEGFECKCFD